MQAEELRGVLEDHPEAAIAVLHVDVDPDRPMTAGDALALSAEQRERFRRGEPEDEDLMQLMRNKTKQAEGAANRTSPPLPAEPSSR